MPTENINTKTTKYLRIRIIAIILLLVLISITYFSIRALADNEFFLDPIEYGDAPSYIFEQADFNIDIFEDEHYNELIKYEFIRYSDGSTTVSVSEESYNTYSDAVQVIFSLVKAAQRGDNISYNSCFSPKYIKKSGEQGTFTMQKIYDVLVKEYPPVREGNYLRTDIELEYRIKENNGTLRNDMGSDAVKTQYITLTTDNTKGVPLIDSVTVLNELKPEPRTYNAGNIAIVAITASIINIAALVATFMIFLKTSAKKISDAT